jgi:hypothetical protein
LLLTIACNYKELATYICNMEIIPGFFPGKIFPDSWNPERLGGLKMVLLLNLRY